MNEWIGLQNIWEMLQNHQTKSGKINHCGCYTENVFSGYNWKVVSLVLPKITDVDSTIKLYRDGNRYTIDYPHTDQCICPIKVVYSYLRVANSCATCEILAGHIIDLEKELELVLSVQDLERFKI